MRRVMTTVRLSDKSIQHPIQTGWDCHLYAIASALSLLHENKKMVQKPLPARKRDSLKSSRAALFLSTSVALLMAVNSFLGSFKKHRESEEKTESKYQSLREYAKQNCSSRTGEINNIANFEKLITGPHPEVKVQRVRAENEEEYHAALTRAIQRKASPIVVFDVSRTDGQPGQPALNKGDPHFAVIVGYSIDAERKITYQLLQWGREFTVDAHALFESASQVTGGVYKEYKKIINQRRGEGAWYPTEHYNERRQAAINTRSTLGRDQDELVTKTILILDVDESPKRIVLEEQEIETRETPNPKSYTGLRFFFDNGCASNEATHALPSVTRKNY